MNGPSRTAGTEAPSPERLHAAMTLPRAKRTDGKPGPPPLLSGALLLVAMGLAVMVPAFAHGLGEGLAAVAIAIPSYVIALFGARRIRGFAMGSFGIDPDGFVHVISGGRSVAEAMRALDDPRGWMTRVWVKGCLVVVVMLGLPAAATVVLGTELPFMALLVLGALVLFAMSRHSLLAGRWRARTGGEVLDARVMPFRLAVFARHRSLDEALGGIGADEFLQVLDEHRPDAERADAAAAAASAAASAAARWNGP